MASSIASSAARTEPRAKVRTGLLRIRRFWLWRRYLMAAALLATTTPLSQSTSSYQRIRECLGHFCTAVFASSSAHWALRNLPHAVIPALAGDLGTIPVSVIPAQAGISKHPIVQALTHLVVLLSLDRATSPLLEVTGVKATIAKVSACRGYLADASTDVCAERFEIAASERGNDGERTFPEVSGGAGSGDGQTPLARHCTCAMRLSLQFATVHV